MADETKHDGLHTDSIKLQASMFHCRVLVAVLRCRRRGKHGGGEGGCTATGKGVPGDGDGGCMTVDSGAGSGDDGGCVAIGMAGPGPVP